MAPPAIGAPSQLPVLPVRGNAGDDRGQGREDACLLGLRESDRVAIAYADMLGRLPWHWFVTLTFRPQHETHGNGVHPEKADKAFRVLVSSINREIFGVRWWKRPQTQLIWARGQEFHKSGRIHFHAVFAAPHADLNALTRRMDWVDWWWREFGIARIERPTDQEDVARYVSKYVVKDGEIDFSPNFPALDQDVPLGLQLRNAPAPRAASFKRAPAEVAMHTGGDRKTDAELAFRCLTLPERLQRPLLNRTHETETRQPETDHEDHD